MKKALSLALTLALCLGLAIPAFAVEPGDTTVTTKQGGTFQFSKPIVGTEQIKFHYHVSPEDLVWSDGEPIFDAGSYYDQELSDEAAGEVTALLVPIGTVVSSPNNIVKVVQENAEVIGFNELYHSVNFSSDVAKSGHIYDVNGDWDQEFGDLEIYNETTSIPEVYRYRFGIKYTGFTPGAVFCIQSYPCKEYIVDFIDYGDNYTHYGYSSDGTLSGRIFVKLVEDDAGAEPTTPVEPAKDIPATGTAYASTQTVEVDGKAVEFQMYALKDEKGNDTNYIKLRDLAQVLSGTQAQFEVDWDGAVNIEPGKAYTPNGSEMSTPFSGDRAYEKATAATNINGEAADLTAIMLKDDQGGAYTYYQLRDLGKALGFNVSWAAGRGIFVETDKPYEG